MGPPLMGCTQPLEVGLRVGGPGSCSRTPIEGYITTVPFRHYLVRAGTRRSKLKANQKATGFRDDVQGASSIGRAFGIMLLFVIIAVLTPIVVDAADNDSITGSTRVVLNLLPFLFVLIGLLLALKEAGMLGGK